VSPLTHLGPEGYAPDFTRRVYATMLERALQIVRTGHSVVLDAVFANSTDRDEIETLARNERIPWVGLWLEAPELVMAGRVRDRSRDASDADVAVVRRQVAQDVGPIRWHRIDASAGREVVEQSARSFLAG
jgi:predicted kinase